MVIFDYLPPIPAWMKDARCASAAVDDFYSDAEESIEYAKRHCEDCPVRLECLRHAFEMDEQWGIWAGYTARERRAIKKKMQGGAA